VTLNILNHVQSIYLANILIVPNDTDCILFVYKKRNTNDHLRWSMDFQLGTTGVN